MSGSADKQPAPDPDVHLGYKRLTVENWQLPDKLIRLFVTLDLESGHYVPETADSWARSILEPQLLESVPEDIRQMFEVARGAMLYGFFFYPTITLATEQLDRIVDAALVHRLATAQLDQIVDVELVRRLQPLEKSRFVDRIAAAAELGIIVAGERIVWEARRQLRNHAAHATDQTTLSPSDALNALHIAAEQINGLFPTGQTGGVIAT